MKKSCIASLIVLSLTVVPIISFNTQAHPDDGDKTRIAQLEGQVQALIGDNARIKQEFEGLLKSAQDEMTKRQNNFEGSVNDQITTIKNEQTQLRTDITNELSNTKTSLNKLISDSAPVGTVLGFLGPKPENLPEEWRLCDGSMVSKNEYPNLFKVLDIENEEIYQLPDMSGQFLRGINVKADIDPDGRRRPGNIQEEFFKKHSHPAFSSSSTNISNHSHNLDGWATMGDAHGGGNNHVLRTGYGGTTTTSGASVLNASTSTTTNIGEIGGNETRPKNIAVFWIIKVK
jgi:microcystin-dependent protein